ncbi:hypothetical protein HQ489_04460 [Candidatus Woesearchaeota archaeon]|nr:hypothetical protein [Candidatus Woesearchaeota archaeon]
MRYKVLIVLMLVTVFLTACGSESVQDIMEDKTVESDDKNVEVKDDGTVHAEDEKTSVDLKVEDDTVKTEVKTEAIPKVTNKVAIAEWCVKGQKYEFSGDNSGSSTVIQGVETYKGSEFCKGISSTKAGPMEIETTYYFTQGGEEMWVISDVAGTKTETHVTN